MPTELAQHIQETPVVDTQEHLEREPEWVENGPDILQDLFGNYVTTDLVTAGASPQGLTRLMDGNDSDIVGRFEDIRKAWEVTQFTGCGEAVRLIAKHAYDIEELTSESIESAQHKNRVLREPGERYRLLRDAANLDHTQTDDKIWECTPDESGLDFFLYDLSWRSFCDGDIDPEQIEAETGAVVTDLGSLKRGMEAIFAKHAPTAIAVKSQHAYTRTLESEVADGYMTEKLAIAIAERIMRGNQFDCFDINGTQSNIHAAACHL